MRRYMGWYDGNPSMLFPEQSGGDRPRGGGPRRRCRADPGPGTCALRGSGTTQDVQRALHLVDFVLFHGEASSAEARTLKAELLDARRAGDERSFVAHNILASAAKLEREGRSVL